jgi:hypothetical protein
VFLGIRTGSVGDVMAGQPEAGHGHRNRDHPITNPAPRGRHACGRPAADGARHGRVRRRAGRPGDTGAGATPAREYESRRMVGPGPRRPGPGPGGESLNAGGQHGWGPLTASATASSRRMPTLHLWVKGGPAAASGALPHARRRNPQPAAAAGAAMIRVTLVGNGQVR